MIALLTVPAYAAKRGHKPDGQATEDQQKKEEEGTGQGVQRRAQAYS
jgi:hypothetical protein